MPKQEDTGVSMARASCDSDKGFPARAKAVLLEQRLTVRHQPCYLVERFGGENERRLRHPFDRLAAGVVGSCDQMMMNRARSRDDLRRRHASYRDSIVVNFFGKTLREALERGLFGTVAYAAAKDGGALVWSTAGSDRRA